VAAPSNAGALPLRLYFDGGSRGNPGPAGCAAVLRVATGGDGGAADGEASGPVVAYSYRGLGSRTTNNVAEYEGLILGLLLVKDLGLAPGRLVAVHGDSMLVVKQVTGAWAVKDASMAALHAEACRLLQVTGVRAGAISHVYREHNSHADAYAQIAVDTQSGQSFRDAAYFPGHRTSAPAPSASAAAAAAAAIAAAYATTSSAAKGGSSAVEALAAAAVAAARAGAALDGGEPHLSSAKRSRHASGAAADGGQDDGDGDGDAAAGGPPASRRRRTS